MGKKKKKKKKVFNHTEMLFKVCVLATVALSVRLSPMGMDNSMDDTVINIFDKMKSYFTLSIPCLLQLSGSLQLELFFFFPHPIPF